LDGIPVGISSGAIAWAALEVPNARKQGQRRLSRLFLPPPERYLSSWLFADVGVESDSLTDLFSGRCMKFGFAA